MRVLRFFACILIALVPLLIVAAFDWAGLSVGRANAGSAMVCTILLLSYIAWLGFRPEQPRGLSDGSVAESDAPNPKGHTGGIL